MRVAGHDVDVDHEVVKETWGYTEAMVAEYRSKKLEDWRRRGLDATDPRRLDDRRLDLRRLGALEEAAEPSAAADISSPEPPEPVSPADGRGREWGS